MNESIEKTDYHNEYINDIRAEIITAIYKLKSVLCMLDGIIWGKFLPKDETGQLLNKINDISKNIRDDALSGKINFDEVKESVFSEYKNIEQKNELEVREKHYMKLKINVKVNSEYDTILAAANKLNIPESNIIVKSNLITGKITVIDKLSESIIYQTQVEL